MNMIRKDDRNCGPSLIGLKSTACDLATAEKIREMFRDGLLILLSQARAESMCMDIAVRERLLDDISKNFHPDGTASDLFGDAFHATIEGLENEIDERASELGVAAE